MSQRRRQNNNRGGNGRQKAGLSPEKMHQLAKALEIQRIAQAQGSFVVALAWGKYAIDIVKDGAAIRPVSIIEPTRGNNSYNRPFMYQGVQVE
jgi:hypothetical protein